MQCLAKDSSVDLKVIEAITEKSPKSGNESIEVFCWNSDAIYDYAV